MKVEIQLISKEPPELPRRASSWPIAGRPSNGGAGAVDGRRSGPCRGSPRSGRPEVLVNEAHSARMTPPDMLPRGVQYIQGHVKPDFHMCGIDSSFDAAFLLTHNGAGMSAGASCPILPRQGHLRPPFERAARGRARNERLPRGLLSRPRGPCGRRYPDLPGGKGVSRGRGLRCDQRGD